MADLDWDFGKPEKMVTLAMPRDPDGRSSDSASEVFRITNCARGCIIRATRPRDHVDLIFYVLGYRCRGLGDRDREPRLARLRVVRDRRLKVVFPPQHIAEQINNKPLGDEACQSAQAWGPMRVRMSQPSRVVFKIPGTAKWMPRLALNELTNWSRLNLVVHKRADVGVEIVDQLKAAFPDHYPAQLADLDFAIAQGFLAAQLEGPSDGETALEMAGRLIFSPSSRGRWQVPDKLAKAGPVPLWTARLDREGRQSVVALWSSRLEPGRLPINLDRPEGTGSMLSLDRQNHWDIVLQTSLRGWPALRGLPAPAKTTVDAEIFLDPVSISRPSVVRPDISIGFLNEIDTEHGYTSEDSGIALARPFEDGDISLSALGGLPVLNWNGDPPSIFWTVKGEPIGVPLARLFYRGYLGRETEVVAVEKGFLFPLGIRASLVTVHERAIYPDTLGDPVSYLIKRRFIVTPRKPHTYPGPYQPYDGREFPPRRVQLKTLVTPDLATPINIALPIPIGSAPLPQESIFWPQTVSGSMTSDIEFEWSTEDAASVRSKLIFVMNNVVRREDAMRALVDYYNGEADPRRTASLGGARHRYAEPKREGDTSFDTTSWLLGVQGRRDGIDGAEHFAFDGRMEGANQPPFYPLMDRGYVGMQTIEQLLGTPHGQVEVRYFDDYRHNGIETKHQIFLTLKNDALALTASDKVDRSGGIASPDLNVAAISRLTGPVGGSAGMALANGELDFGDAAAGAFNPGQFFGDAKLLGVVPLAQIVKVATAALSLAQAPKLLDETLFGARDELKLVQKVAAGMLDALYGGRDNPVSRLEVGIQAADAFLGAAGLSLSEVYRSLVTALEPLRKPDKIKQQLKTIVAAAGPSDARKPIEELVPEVRALLDAVADVNKDPVPDAFEAIIDNVRTIFGVIFKGAEAEARDLAGNAYALIIGWLKDAFCEAIDDEGFGPILFGEYGTVSCAQIFSDPPAALRGIEDGLYGAVFAEAWNVLAEVLALETDIRARLDLELEQGRNAFRNTVQSAVTTIAARLAVQDPAVEDVRQPLIQDRFVSSVLRDVTAVLLPPDGTMTSEQARDYAELLSQSLPATVCALVQARLAELLPTILPAGGVDPQLLLDELSVLVLREVTARLIDPLVIKATALRDRLTKAVDEAGRSGYERVLSLICKMFEALARSSALASLARAGRAVAAVCETVSEAAQFIGDGVMGASVDLAAAAQSIITAANRIQAPAGPGGRPLSVAVAALIGAAERALALTRTIEAERQRLTAAAGELCASTRDYLDPVAAIVRHRRGLAVCLADVADQCIAIEVIFTASQPSAADRAALSEVVSKAAAFAEGALGIEVLCTPSAALDAAVASIQAAQVGSDAYRQRLGKIVADLTTRAAALHDELNRALSPEDLKTLVDTSVREFETLFDREFTAFLLQCVGFTPSIITAVENAVGSAVQPFVGYLLPIYHAVEVVGRMVLDRPRDPVLRKVYALAIGGSRKLEELEQALATLTEERETVEALARAPSLPGLTTLVSSYKDGTAALPSIVKAVASLSLTDVGQNLTDALRDELRQIEEEVRALVLQFVPTKLQTRYFWPTQLKRFPDDDANWLFQPTDTLATTSPTVPPRDHPAAEQGFNWHLWIDAHFSFDILTGQREIDVLGVLRPFELRLLSDTFDMLTIAFDETRFTAKNGANSDFKVTVKDVTIGPFLEFVKKLQDWLAPSGSGFYLQPAAKYPGIEVGYIYDAGIIQLGALQFINVAFRISAILPFSKDSVSGGEARFVFALSSRDRPFLISSPPYGGGGWVTITCTSQEVESLDLAFVFGGVAAIKFGPLDAQGRIVAGIRVQSMPAVDGKRAHVVTAIFEAVGEGSLACFSICVSLRVTLTQRTGGALFGQTDYSFSFKVGFVRLSYAVSARYRLSNGSDPAALTTLVAPGTPALLKTKIPRKEDEWQAYRRYFDLALLEAA